MADDRIDNVSPMATLHRAKTHSVRIRGMSFRCEPGSRREQILIDLMHRDSRGKGLLYFSVGLLASCAFMLGLSAGWLI